MLQRVNADNARIFGSDDDFVAIGEPVFGATGHELDHLTEISAAAPAGYAEVGWLHPDGVSLEPTDEVAKLKGFQGGRTVRTKITSSETAFKFQALESTALTFGLALDARETDTTTGGLLKKRLKGAREVIQKSFVIGLFDGERKWLLYIPLGEIGERNEIPLGREEIVALEFNVEIIGDAFLLADDKSLEEEGITVQGWPDEGAALDSWTDSQVAAFAAYIQLPGWNVETRDALESAIELLGTGVPAADWPRGKLFAYAAVEGIAANAGMTTAELYDAVS